MHSSLQLVSPIGIAPASFISATASASFSAVMPLRFNSPDVFGRPKIKKIII